MNFNSIKKIASSKTLGVITSIATIISTVDGFISDRKKANEFEALKESVSNLEKVVSELQKNN